jgi:hypothetical protein
LFSYSYKQNKLNQPNHTAYSIEIIYRSTRKEKNEGGINKWITPTQNKKVNTMLPERNMLPKIGTHFQSSIKLNKNKARTANRVKRNVMQECQWKIMQ